MRTIIAGSRDFTCYEEVLGIVADSGFKITQVVSGDARGVDRIGIQIAQDYSIPFVRPVIVTMAFGEDVYVILSDRHVFAIIEYI